MIGIYDSGIGGLGIFNAIRAILPQEHMRYFGDTAHFPFGTKPAKTVQQLTLAGLQRLATDCNIIVIACNTASVNDLDYYRAQINVPIIGVVPVIKTAAQLTENNIIALLATPVTVQAPYTETLIQQFAPDKQVMKLGCTDLADAIESGKVTTALLERYLTHLRADVVVLGCTHYTLIKGQIQQLVGPDVKVIDSNEAVARQVLRIMQRDELFQPHVKAHYHFECSGDTKIFLKQVKKYTGLAH